MARYKIKKGKVKSFNLTEEQIAMVATHTAESPFTSESDFIGYLIENYDAMKDPHKELLELEKRESSFNDKIQELKKQKKTVLKRMEAHKEKEKYQKNMVAKAIEVIKRKYIEGEQYSELLRLARVHSLRLQMDPFELMYRAGMEMKQEV